MLILPNIYFYRQQTDILEHKYHCFYTKHIFLGNKYFYTQYIFFSPQIYFLSHKYIFKPQIYF